MADSDATSNVTTRVITIDGPAGAGKSTVARGLAERFGYAFLDTGAMYRAITLACLRNAVDWGDPDAITGIAKDADIRFGERSVWLNGADVTAAIRTPEVTEHIRFVADNPAVRAMLGVLQRRIASGQRIVTEGRDQGTEVFPDAICKIFLTATAETRARRRQSELHQVGQRVTFDEVLRAQQQRDLQDATRAMGALRPADDAVIVHTDEMDHDQVIQRLVEIVVERCGEEVPNSRASSPR